MQNAKCKVQSWLRNGCLILLVCGMLLCNGCSIGKNEPERKKYNASFLTLFDTVTVITGFAKSEESFTATAQAVHDDLLRYHQLFDIYKDYEGVNNLKTINDNAGIAPVSVDPAVIDLLTDCRRYYEATGGKVNVAMGSVLYLWHVARNDGLDNPAEAYLPDMTDLEAAAQHTSFDAVVIDREASTVFLSDPAARLDVGAIAKGWSVQRVCENAPEGLLISVGGKSLVEISIYIEYIVIVELRVVTGRACSCVLFQCHFWSLLVGVGQRCSTCTFAVAAESGVCFDLPYILQQVDGSGKRGGKVTSVVDGTSSIL